MKQETSAAAGTGKAGGRIDSIDIIRGLTILVMIFVNDVGGVKDTPGWMKHMPTFTDGMTFVDLVFPSFLFIVGMSVPFSIGKRLSKDSAYLPVIRHLITRVFALIVIGFFMVNSDSISGNGIINPHLWTFLMYIAVIILWSRSNTILQNKIVKISSVLLLIILFFIYRGNDVSGLIQMRTQWWGILGLIGWSYLIAVLIYIPLRNNQAALTGSIVILYCFFLAGEAGMHSGFAVIDAIRGFSSHTAVVISGILIGTMLNKFSLNYGHKNILLWAFGYSMFLFFAGFFLHQLNGLHTMFIISKNLGTVPWCLFSSAITVWVWIIIYWLVDINGITTGTKLLKNAGMNPLFAYILAPLVIEIIYLVSNLFGNFNFYWWLGESFITGFTRSIVLALTMTWLTGYLSRKGLQMKL